MATVTTGKQVTHDLIATISATGGPLSFTSIPQTYQSLVVHIHSVLSTAPNSGFAMQFNSDTGMNYFGNYLYATNYMSLNSGFNSNNTGNAIQSAFNNSTGNGAIIHIADYTDATIVKSVYTVGGSGNGLARGSYVWSATGAISTITFSATNFATGNLIHLYGLKKV